MKQNRMRRIPLVLLLVACGVNGSAQTGTGRIRGTVTNPDGPVVAAPVRATHQASGRISSATSTNSGQFTLTDSCTVLFEHEPHYRQILEDICTENNKFPEYAGIK